MSDTDAKLMTILEDNVDHAKRRLQAYKESCPDCRIFNDTLLREADMNIACYCRNELYSKGDGYYCKTCHRCVYDRD
jgi:hypothetical protein